MKKVKLKLALITFSTFPTIQKNNLLSCTLIFSFLFNKKVVLNSLTLLLFADISYDNNKKSFKLFSSTFQDILYFVDASSFSLVSRFYWRHSGVFIVGFEQISHIVLVFPLLTLNK